VESTLQSLTSAIEPVLIVLLGGMVGFIVISLLLPLVTAVQSLAGGQGGAEGG
jgi:type IV pilus assembly protein PilC